MAGYSVIAEIGEAIVRLLKNELVPDVLDSEDAIGLCSPDQKGDLALGVYLYDVRESAEMAEQQAGMKPEGEDMSRYPSTFLTLFYMITAYSEGDQKFCAAQEQRALGKIIQVFNDHPVLNEETPGLWREDYPIRISMMRVSNEEKIKLWNNMPDFPYKLSLYYKVYPAEIASNRKKPVKRVLDSEFIIQEEKRKDD